MQLFEKIRSRIVVSLLFILILFFSFPIYAKEEIDRNSIEGVWHDWCATIKAELKSAYVFNTRANNPSMGSSGGAVRFVDFDSLIIPVPEEEAKKISIKHGDSGYATFKLFYESGLRISVSRKNSEIITDVFERFSIDLPAEIANYLSSKYGGGPEPHWGIFQQPVSFLDLRISGFRLTPDDLNCDAKFIEETLEKIPRILAAASSDFSASQSGKDVAFWSENGISGVITRQEEAFSPASEKLRTIWSGEFMKGSSTYQVLISFFSDDSETFDFLGYHLAKPRA